MDEVGTSGTLEPALRYDVRAVGVTYGLRTRF